MTTATTLLSTAHTIGQIRKACRAQCVGLTEKRDAKGNYERAEYRFGDRSIITIIGSKIRVGQYVYRETDAIHPRDRKCVSPDCWACDGTGIHHGKPCIWNDGVPF